MKTGRFAIADAAQLAAMRVRTMCGSEGSSVGFQLFRNAAALARL